MTFKPNPNVIYFGETFSVRLSKVGYFSIIHGDASKPRNLVKGDVLSSTPNRKYIDDVLDDLFRHFEDAQKCWDALKPHFTELDREAARRRTEHSKRMSEIKKARDAKKAARK